MIGAYGFLMYQFWARSGICCLGPQKKHDAFKSLMDFIQRFKGIVHFKIHFWYVLVYLKGIQDVGVFVSAVNSILICFGQTVLVCQSYNAGLWSPPQRACTEKVQIKHDFMTCKCKYTLMA